MSVYWNAPSNHHQCGGKYTILKICVPTYKLIVNSLILFVFTINAFTVSIDFMDGETFPRSCVMRKCSISISKYNNKKNIGEDNNQHYIQNKICNIFPRNFHSFWWTCFFSGHSSNHLKSAFYGVDNKMNTTKTRI